LASFPHRDNACFSHFLNELSQHTKIIENQIEAAAKIGGALSLAHSFIFPSPDNAVAPPSDAATAIYMAA
jgi:hypothetical protein